MSDNPQRELDRAGMGFHLETANGYIDLDAILHVGELPSLVSWQESRPLETSQPLPESRLARKQWNITRQQAEIILSEVLAKEDRIRELDSPLTLENDEKNAWASGCLNVIRRFLGSMHDTLSHLLEQKSAPANPKNIPLFKGRILELRKQLDILSDVIAREIMPRLSSH